MNTCLKSYCVAYAGFILATDQYKIPKDKNKHIVKQKT
jgi:hypothetical protein